MANPELVIVTGLSGAGKSTAVRCFEELGYFTVDNLPPSLLPTFVRLCADRVPPVEHIATVIDVRGGEFLEGMRPALAELDEAQIAYRILFLDADTHSLVSRFKEHRFPHPLHHRYNSLLQCIDTERTLLEELKERASVVLDTSDETVRQLRGEILRLFSPEGGTRQRTVHVITFGYKYGVPPDVDYVFDVRYLRNPHHDLELRPLTGEHPAVRAYVESDPRTDVLRHKVFDLLDFALPNHWDEGRWYVSIGVGCTGGKHRSVMFGEDIARHCGLLGYHVAVQNRDCGRE